MDREDLRLELIKLTHHHGVSAAEVKGRAEQYEEFILAHKSEDKSPPAPTQKVGQANRREQRNP